jgi:single-stranded-DNA-specific exonuclease
MRTNVPQLKKQWILQPPLSEEAEDSLQAYPPTVRQLLFNRGQAESEAARRYLSADTPGDNDPWKLLHMDAAIERIRGALRGDERILVYGDYDVDGVTATVLLVEMLKALGGQVIPYIPNRFTEGYGLQHTALERLLEERTIDLIVTVDCGIRSLAEAAFLHERGVDLIITDHHHPGVQLPEAEAVLNPRQAGDGYPEKNLSGVGLAYKLSQALAEASGLAPDRVEAGLDLVALGTVADLVSLTGENRSLVRQGLAKLRQPQRQGVLSLIGVAGLRPERLQASDIGYALGPRLNAAGRLESAGNAYRLLISGDLQESGRLAQKLDNQNRERQQLTREIERQAEIQALSRVEDPLLLFAAHEEFSQGVVGLAASRLMKKFYRPAIVAQRGETHTRGSCRSIPEFHITEALDQCAPLLDQYGGHAAAAGFTVGNEQLGELTERLSHIAQEQLGDQVLEPRLEIDLELPLHELGPDLLQYLDLLEPTGMGNPAALFVSRNLTVQDARVVGRDGAHLKLRVSDGRASFEAIAFRFGELAANLPARLDLAYAFETNEFRGQVSPQLNVKDIRPSS